MELIEKDKVIAEIERQRMAYIEEPSKYKVISRILSFLDTLEVKEVNLDREIRRYRMRNSIIQHREESLYDYMANVAKHFFELGIKAAQKGE